MALDTNAGLVQYDAPEKDLYEVGEIPPMGYVPKQMYAWTIRRERHGEPCLLYTSPSPRDLSTSRMPSSA